MSEWIPVTWHKVDDEEKEGLPEGTEILIDCPLPDDGQEILVSLHGGRVMSTINWIDEYEHYLDDNIDWADDVVAWMPLPEPYKEVEDEV